MQLPRLYKEAHGVRPECLGLDLDSPQLVALIEWRGHAIPVKIIIFLFDTSRERQVTTSTRAP